MIPDENKDAASDLSKALRAAPSLYSLGTAGNPLWLGFSLTELLLLANDSKILYATGSYDSSSKSARLLAITTDLVLEAILSEISGEDAKRTVKAVPRSGLRTVSVQAGETPFSNAAFSEWPGDLIVTAEFEGLSSPAVFPLERTQSGNDDVRSLLRELLVDLARGDR